MKSSLEKIFPVAFVLSLVWAGALACTGVTPTRNENFKAEMQSSYSAAFALFREVWSPQDFSDPQKKKEILTLLDTLSKNFHGVEAKLSKSQPDPGFAAAIEINQAIIQDSKRRFEQGHVDYAAWQLRSLTHGCVTCHTHYKRDLNFIGEAPLPASDSAQDRLEAASFLIATRQFPRASDELLKIASLPGGIYSPEQVEFQALKLWMLVQLKAEPKYGLIVSELNKLSKLGRFRSETGEAVGQWIKDLERLGKGIKIEASVNSAEGLLAPVKKSEVFLDDEKNLVQTLLATSLLHDLLPDRTGDERKKVVYLLGLAYHHLPILELDVFRTLYLEQTIREFPGSQKAKDAYGMYEKDSMLLSSGSGGLQMDEEEKASLDALRELAFR